MRLYCEEKNYKLYHGNMLELETFIQPESIDSIVTDPPYELGFMGKSWDNSGIAFQKETWEKCLKVLKPGGYLLAFGGSRTFHRIACAIEDAGFEIRDTIMWLYGSGFPKSMNVGLAIDKKNNVKSEILGYRKTSMQDFRDVGEKQKEISGIDKLSFGQIENSERKESPIYKAQNDWDGWGTTLKPAYEPIIVARKPCKGSCIDNVLKYNTGAINIDECRVGEPYSYSIKENGFGSNFMDDNWQPSGKEYQKEVSGRFPANVILTYNDTDFNEVCGGFPNNKRSADDSGSAARYFYCAKANKKDRDEGLEKTNRSPKKNTHPTVKPTELMQYLIRLVTPAGGTVLDPFNGSGSTGKAAMYENRERNKLYKYIGIEMTEEYLQITKARIDYVTEKEEDNSGQMTIYDL